jgi:chloramphenicol-sensitive protein RarD
LLLPLAVSPSRWWGCSKYIAPSIQFLLGVFVYGEPFNQVRLIGFSLIWLALFGLFSGEYG